MATQGDAQRYLPEAERQIPLSVKYADRWILDAIQTEFGLAETAAAMALAAVEAHPTGRAVSYSRSKGFYRHGGHRHPLIRSYRAVVGGADHLDQLGLIDHFPQAPGCLGWQSAFAAKPHLVATVQRLIFGGPRLRLVSPTRLTLLRDANGIPKVFQETREMQRQERRTSAFNEAITAADIRLAGETDNALTLGGHMVRIFNEDFKRGGRYYAPGRNWQNCPSEDRARLQIDGERVVELDYSAFHPSLLYAEIGAAPPEDCYDIDGWPRDLVKVAVLVMINAPTWGEAVGAITASEEMKACEKVGPEARAEAARLIRDIKRAHEPIAHRFNTSAGLRLMRTDADLAEAIMKEMIVDRGVVTLSVHDSFIVPASKRADLEAAMEATPGRFGLPRLRFKAA